jgi:uncharacterized NAD(P)/FAD-binding protein YdhS
VAVTLFEPGDDLGRGVAYATTDLRHLMNTPASAISSDPADSGAFVRWLAARDLGADPYSFQPRAHYGRYLAEVLDAAIHAASPCATLTHLRERVVRVELDSASRTPCLRLASGAAISADSVILAVGHLAPSTAWAPTSLLEAPQFVADPWRSGAIDGVRRARRDSGPVLLVGTGLTMVDVAMSLERTGLRMVAVSRTGQLPHAHSPKPEPPLPPAVLEPGPDLARVRRAVLQHIARARRESGDWRPGFDSLRPIITPLWQALTAEGRHEFITEYRREWDVHRHRLSPQAGTWLSAAIASGRLEVMTADVQSAQATPGNRSGVHVRLSSGVELEAHSVVNCTGPSDDFATATDPMINGLLADGLSRPGPLGMGLDTAPDGRLVDQRGDASSPIWVIGAARRGTLWESTAIPEVRRQARDVAQAALTRASHRGQVSAPIPR